MKKKKGNLLLMTFAIQQLSLAVMHAMPVQTKHSTIVVFVHAGGYRRHWQGWGCIIHV